MKKKKVIAIVAHDNRKKDMMEWVAWNWKELSPHSLICTGTTGKLVNAVLVEKCRENDVIPPNVERLKSGPLGGDQQLGALICEGKVDVLIFFWDPMQPQPHDVDVKALLRISTLYNINLTVQPWPTIMAAAVLTTVPLMVVFFFAQRYILDSVVISGMK
ncbi:MAG: methylglyoxal synthase [Bacteroidota bacterium]|nr:methylglyoxal synthase [Bacteroidota bacterium]